MCIFTIEDCVLPVYCVDSIGSTLEHLKTFKPKALDCIFFPSQSISNCLRVRLKIKEIHFEYHFHQRE